MVQKEIEQEFQETVTETETKTLIFCDGCTAECSDSYTTLSNISPECVENNTDSEHMLLKTADNAETFHFCDGCQLGIREQGRTIDASLYSGEDNADSAEPLETNTKVLTHLGRLWFGAMAIILYILPVTGFVNLGLVGFVVGSIIMYTGLTALKTPLERLGIGVFHYRNLI